MFLRFKFFSIFMNSNRMWKKKLLIQVEVCEFILDLFFGLLSSFADVKVHIILTLCWTAFSKLTVVLPGACIK